MIYIIGSGLSAIAAASALVRRGYHPTILDAGVGPDRESQKLKERLAATGPELWNTADVSQLKRTGKIAFNGIPRKFRFGSDFTFEEAENAVPLEIRGASVYRSFAIGGFSNVWGAVIHPLEFREMKGWPVSPADLSPHFAAMRALMRCDADDGSMAERFPLQAPGFELRPSSQALALHADLASAGERLRRHGIRFEYARLAVMSAGRDGRKGCLYCGQCIYGCPYDSIYTAPVTLARLIREGRVVYRPGMVIDRLSHSEGQVLIEGRSIKDGTTCQFRGRSVFVGAGLLETARILLTSLGLYDKPVEARHSDIFTLPLIRYRTDGGVLQEKLHTLCQIVLEVEDLTICPDFVRLQFYGYNDLYSTLLKQKAGRLASLFGPFLRALAARLFVAFGYLHSDVSSRISMTLIRADKPRLRVNGIPNPKAGQICRAVSRKLFQNRECLRAIPLNFQLRLDLPGGGYHSGSSFPMRRTPKDLETDVWGALPSLPGVHVVDASVLPSVPTSPIAFTVMANAHRIASRCPLRDES